MTNKLINTDESLCEGCNKCIFKCPVRANEARYENGENKIHVVPERCIDCGECINICDHKARLYEDDTERFFADIAAGVPISIIAAPAARTNFDKLDRLFGYLKSIGVKLIYDVSYGADICTWAYIKTIKDRQLTTMISQPCPVVVNYIEKYQPTLLPYLSPVHSPALCTAVYLKEYKNVTDQIAFLSPCIAKTSEFTDPNTKGYVSYNVTYKKLIEYIKMNNINLMSYRSAKYDNIEGSVGFTFSRPGGLKENVHFYLGSDVWVKQVEGIDHIKDYFREYEKDIAAHRPVPLLVDALNCEHGCNLGTATQKNITENAIDDLTNRSKAAVTAEDGERIFEYFDNNLKLEDFLRTYNNRSDEIPTDNVNDLEAIFNALGKTTEKERNINCFSCGYGSCKEFALAIANGHNHKENCAHYARIALAETLTQFDEMFHPEHRGYQ